MGFLRLIGAHIILFSILLFGWMIPSESVWENIQQAIAVFIAAVVIMLAVAGLFYGSTWLYGVLFS